jgi:hypothetical protein
VRLVSPIGGATGGSGNLSTIVCLTLRGCRHIQNLCGFSTPTAMGQAFIMTLFYLICIVIFPLEIIKHVLTPYHHKIIKTIQLHFVIIG